jgi:hypothetical protein
LVAKSNRIRIMSLIPNPLRADRLTAQERLDDVAFMLAAGLMRLRARQSSRLSEVPEDSCVDFTANQSGGAVETLATEDGS